MTCTCLTLSSAAAHRGRAIPSSSRANPSSAPKRRRGSCSVLGPPDHTTPIQQIADPSTEALDQFAKQGVPRWVTNDAPTQAAYDQLVERVCPCVIIVHSQGGNFGFNAALRAHDKIKALVAIEPSGAPYPGKVDVAQLKTVPHLFVFGDHLQDSPSWQNSSKPHSALSRRPYGRWCWISC